jgi:hypothetical protein
MRIILLLTLPLLVTCAALSSGGPSDLPDCAAIHCTTVDCEGGDYQIGRSCTCHWPPANDIQCWDDSGTVDRMTGCAEQADLWCTRAGFPGGGCVVWYATRCMPTGPDATMYSDELADCLAAIVTTPLPRTEPLECVETWR